MARPLKYKTEEELVQKINEYLNYISGGTEKREFLDSFFEKITPTKTNFRIFLDISRPVYNDYKKRFPNTIKKVEDIIEDYWVQGLRGNNVAGTIFYLKNAFKEDYRDRYDTDLTTKGEKIPAPIYGALSKHTKDDAK